MGFFQKLFTLNRTKMIDEAAFFHKPVPLGKGILTFFLSFIIASLLSAFAQSIPLLIYIFGKLGSPNASDENALEEYMERLESSLSSLPDWFVGVELFASVAFFAVALYQCKRREQRSISTMGIRKKDCVPEFLIGYAIGLTLFALPVLLAVSFGAAKLSLSSFRPIIILFFFGFLVEGFSKEAFARGYFMTSVARDYSPAIAVCVSSVAFSVFSSALSFDIIYLLNSILLGLLLGFYVFKRGSIIGASAIHAGFAFARKCIFGANNSSIFFLEKTEAKAALGGGLSGIDSGLCLTLVLVLGIFLVLLTKTKDTELSEFECPRAE